MPDFSFPELTPPNSQFHSASPTLIGIDKKSRFPSFLDSNQEPWYHSWPAGQHDYRPESNSILNPVAFHAEPLAPLRQRDEQALDDIFEDIQVDAIIADICSRLKQLHPEPCWDDEPFDFLRGYV